MKLNHDYYGTDFTGDDVRQRTMRVVRALPALMEELKADAVVVTGLSGISIAFAALSRIDFPLFVVRKSGERSHGSRIEGLKGHQVRRFIVLDDFVSSGETVRTIAEAVKHAQAFGIPAQCVGILQHSRSDFHHDIRVGYDEHGGRVDATVFSAVTYINDKGL